MVSFIKNKTPDGLRVKTPDGIGMVKYPINLLDQMIFTQNSHRFTSKKSQKEVPPPSPQEFEASIKNDISPEDDGEQPICFTEDQIYEI